MTIDTRNMFHGSSPSSEADEVRRDQPGTATSPPPPPPPAARPDERGAAGPRRPGTVVSALTAAAVAAATSFGVVAVADPSADAGDAGSAADEVGQEDQVESIATSQDAGEAMTVSEIADRAAPSVAHVEVQVGAGRGTGQGGAGQGSAVIIDSDGLLATNNHVVANATEVSVILADGERHQAEVLGTDPTTDLAVLQIDATDLPAIELATELPQIGTTAVAIGSPFGLDGSVTSGIVSALDRTLSGQTGNLAGLIQTDAAINPGNSGGALLDDQARLIGINTAILSGSGANDGVGFAVPSTVVADITEQLVTTGEVQRAVLGVSGQDVDPQVAAAYGLDVQAGALIVAVAPDSAAERAGLEQGDIITAVDGEQVTSMTELAAAIRAHEPGASVELEVTRAGERRTVDVALD